MTRDLPRTHFHSSRLIRFFADRSLLDTVEPESAFAEKLGLWVGFADAINLSSVHATKLGRGPFGVPQDAGMVLREEVRRMRNTFSQAVKPAPKPRQSSHMARSRIEWPEPTGEASASLATAFEPYRRFYAAHQRDMELKIRAVRKRVRSVLSQASPALQKLAALDSALDAILHEREGSLLANVPSLLKTRFDQMRTKHQQLLAQRQQADAPATWMQAGNWLADFCSELETALLDEWDLRLEPTAGLIDALHHELSQHP
jgi:hypothetical protein